MSKERTALTAVSAEQVQGSIVEVVADAALCCLVELDKVSSICMLRPLLLFNTLKEVHQHVNQHLEAI